MNKKIFDYCKSLYNIFDDDLTFKYYNDTLTLDEKYDILEHTYKISLDAFNDMMDETSDFSEDDFVTVFGCILNFQILYRLNQIEKKIYIELDNQYKSKMQLSKSLTSIISLVEIAIITNNYAMFNIIESMETKYTFPKICLVVYLVEKYIEYGAVKSSQNPIKNMIIKILLQLDPSWQNYILDINDKTRYTIKLISIPSQSSRSLFNRKLIPSLFNFKTYEKFHVNAYEDYWSDNTEDLKNINSTSIDDMSMQDFFVFLSNRNSKNTKIAKNMFNSSFEQINELSNLNENNITQNISNVNIKFAEIEDENYSKDECYDLKYYDLYDMGASRFREVINFLELDKANLNETFEFILNLSENLPINKVDKIDIDELRNHKLLIKNHLENENYNYNLCDPNLLEYIACSVLYIVEILDFNIEWLDKPKSIVKDQLEYERIHTLYLNYGLRVSHYEVSPFELHEPLANLILELQYNLEIAKKNEALKEVNKQLEKEKQQKNELINANAHSWKHIVYPNIVLDIATSLYEENQIEKAAKLFEVHNSQTLLVNNLKLLETQYNSTDQEFRFDLQDSFCSPRHEKAVGILEVFDYALNTVLSKILLEKIYSKHDNIFNEFNRLNLQESFINKIIKKDISTIEWFNKEIYKINITNTNQWKEIHAKRDDFGFILLVDIFINLINNIINYGVKTKEGYINIDLTKDDYYYFIKLTNPIDCETSFLPSQKKGLNSIKTQLCKFNNATDNIIINEDSVFEISLRFDLDIIGG